MTYATHGTVAGVDLPALFVGLFAMAMILFVWGVAIYPWTLRGFAAGYGATLAAGMWYATYVEARE